MFSRWGNVKQAWAWREARKPATTDDGGNMKGNAYKVSFPSSKRKERKMPSVYPLKPLKRTK